MASGQGAGAQWLQAVADVLTFRTFVSPSVLVAVYYVGAISIPLLAWLLARRVVAGLQSRDTRWEVGRSGQRGGSRTRVGALTLLIFLGMELGWRMLFEFLLAYFQIRDALVRPVP